MGRRGRRVGDLLRHELQRKKERRGGERENASRVTKSTEAKSVCIFRYLEILKESLWETAFPKNSWDSQVYGTVKFLLLRMKFIFCTKEGFIFFLFLKNMRNSWAGEIFFSDR